MKVSDFDFDLPDEAIALRPTVPRDHARLLQVMPSGQTSDHHVFDLVDILRSGDVLVVNETRVLPAALTGIRLARPVGGNGDITIKVNLHQQTGPDSWIAFARPAKRLKVEDVIHFSKELKSTVSERSSGREVTLQFNQSGEKLMAAIDQLGDMPIPPYIARQRAADKQDLSDYQTIYATNTGSVAAPTAGLHFTDQLINRLDAKGVSMEKVVLHVGAGTFLPIITEDTAEHKMHSEWYSIGQHTADRINTAKSKGQRIIAVGTTSLRALESNVEDGKLQAGTGDTDIFITPGGHKFQIVDGLMTNFHLPRSTLFMLVCALSGFNVMKKAYEYAVTNGYRFYSYGDASLLWKAN